MYCGAIFCEKSPVGFKQQLPNKSTNTKKLFEPSGNHFALLPHDVFKINFEVVLDSCRALISITLDVFNSISSLFMCAIRVRVFLIRNFRITWICRDTSSLHISNKYYNIGFHTRSKRTLWQTNTRSNVPGAIAKCTPAWYYGNFPYPWRLDAATM